MNIAFSRHNLMSLFSLILNLCAAECLDRSEGLHIYPLISTYENAGKDPGVLVGCAALLSLLLTPP